MKERNKIIRAAIKILKTYPLHRIRPFYLKSQYTKTFKVIGHADKHYRMISKLKGD